MDAMLASSGVLVDVLLDQRIVERGGERPVWFQRVCRAHSRLKEILRAEGREARERQERRESAQPPPPLPPEHCDWGPGRGCSAAEGGP